MDTLNSVLINTIIFAFVPMLTAAQDADRTALFLKVTRVRLGLFAGFGGVMLAAPWLMRLLAPGLTAILRHRGQYSADSGAIDGGGRRRRGPFRPAVYGPPLCSVGVQPGDAQRVYDRGRADLWKFVGVYGFAIGYMAGAWAQLAMVYFAARSGLDTEALPQCEIRWREILMKPAFFWSMPAGSA